MPLFADCLVFDEGAEAAARALAAAAMPCWFGRALASSSSVSCAADEASESPSESELEAETSE